MCSNNQISINNTSRNPPKLINIDSNMGDDAFFIFLLTFYGKILAILLKN